MFTAFLSPLSVFSVFSTGLATEAKFDLLQNDEKQNLHKKQNLYNKWNLHKKFAQESGISAKKQNLYKQ